MSYPFTPNQQALIERKLGFLLRLEMGICPFPETDEEVTWFEEYFDQHPQQFTESNNALREMEALSVLSWYELASYLRGQIRLGKTEFRMSVVGQRRLMIRPFGKNTGMLEIKV